MYLKRESLLIVCNLPRVISEFELIEHFLFLADESKPEQETAESKPEESSEAASGEATTSAAAPAAGSEDVELKIEEAGDKKEEPAAEKTGNPRLLFA